MIRSFEEFMNENVHLEEFTKDDFVSYLKRLDEMMKKISINTIVQTGSSNTAFVLMDVSMTKSIMVDSFQRWKDAKLDGFFQTNQFILSVCPIAYFNRNWAGILFNRERDLYVPKIIVSVARGADSFVTKRVFSMLNHDVEEDFKRLLLRNEYVEKIQNVIDKLPALDMKSFRGTHIAKRMGI